MEPSLPLRNTGTTPDSDKTNVCTKGAKTSLMFTSERSG